MNTLCQILDGDSLLQYVTPPPHLTCTLSRSKREVPFFSCYAKNCWRGATQPLWLLCQSLSFGVIFIVNNWSVCFSYLCIKLLKDNFGNPGWILSWGLWPFHGRDLISFEIQSPFPWGICWVIAAHHCHNILQKDPERQPSFIFSFLHLFLSNILGTKKKKKNFSFSYKDI